MDTDSVKKQIARLQKRYINLKTMQQTLVDLIKNPNVSKLTKKFYITDLYSTKHEEEELKNQIKLL
jgi:hypothetical protein